MTRELDGIIAGCGRPITYVSDGTEPTSMAILRWMQESSVEWHHIALASRSRRLRRKLQRRLRDECLNETLFTSLLQARLVLKEMTTTKFAGQITTTEQPHETLPSVAIIAAFNGHQSTTGLQL